MSFTHSLSTGFSPCLIIYHVLQKIRDNICHNFDKLNVCCYILALLSYFLHFTQFKSIMVTSPLLEFFDVRETNDR